MNKLFCVALVAVCVFFSSCGGTTNSDSKTNIPKDIDYQILGNEEDLKNVYNVAIKKMGDDIRFVEKLDISISRPSERGNNGDDALQILIQQIHHTNRNKLVEYSYWSSQGKWDTPQTLTIDLVGGDEESFRLEDNLMDLSGLTFEKLNGIVQDAYKKHKSDNYAYQYISSIWIENGEITIFVRGKLEANELIKYETYKVKL